MKQRHKRKLKQNQMLVSVQIWKIKNRFKRMKLFLRNFVDALIFKKDNNETKTKEKIDL